MKFEKAKEYRDNLKESLKKIRKSESDDSDEVINTRKKIAYSVLQDAREKVEYKEAENAVRRLHEGYYLGDLENMDKEYVKAVEEYVEKEIFPFINNVVNEMEKTEGFSGEKGGMDDKPFEQGHEWKTVRPWYCNEDGAYCVTYIDGESSGLNGYFQKSDVKSFSFKDPENTEKNGLGSEVSRLGRELLSLSKNDIVIFKNFAFKKDKNNRDIELTRNTKEEIEKLIYMSEGEGKEAFLKDLRTSIKEFKLDKYFEYLNSPISKEQSLAKILNFSKEELNNFAKQAYNKIINEDTSFAYELLGSPVHSNIDQYNNITFDFLKNLNFSPSKEEAKDMISELSINATSYRADNLIEFLKRKY